MVIRHLVDDSARVIEALALAPYVLTALPSSVAHWRHRVLFNPDNLSLGRGQG